MRDITIAMVVIESLVDYRKSQSSDNEGLKDNHDTRGGEEVSPNATKYGKGKVSYNKDKGKSK